ncbi:glycoside hydrolase family 16 protein [Amorphotheca resinae ATCC 22711]|uniref:endo-1,3(4)-beta-glucanase n=1 Tax=Amorphotheca resinae ATCC 22711 TaxID=857342 RepID=A0A2T3B7L5_AMORE|nr:glycoside hydrolase family 16 protein [Amorphotheca resinae ATCC 22711]PSS22831.1 glycoside hydrolase family 16 protein [Amorphotheca resinae ATCC 22711]
MRTSRLLLRFGASLFCAAGITSATYVIEDIYDTDNFFDSFNFYTGGDPTAGFVKYVGAVTANDSSLAGYSSGAVYLGVDHKTRNPTGGRDSVRLASNKAYTKGLFIADIAHMPNGICGVWGAFWTFGPNWPSSGEIDIIEGVNMQATDSITLHTSPGCTLGSTGSLPTSNLSNTNCNTGNGNDGCSFSTANTEAFGTGFNAIGGGIYAMEWTSSAIKVYFFPRYSIPADITAGHPDPTRWGMPMASFSGSGCDIDSHFGQHAIVFDITFCGQWAGNVWSSSPCASKAPTCNAYVAQNPAAFTGAYWLINSVKVYQE